MLHKRINTTLAKAKALRKFVEPILTKAKQDSTHSRRIVFSYFQDKLPVKELFDNIAPRIADRPGGYTRIIRLGNRLGDNAEMCMIELVDYNDLFQKRAKSEKDENEEEGEVRRRIQPRSQRKRLLCMKELLTYRYLKPAWRGARLNHSKSRVKNVGRPFQEL